MGKALQPKSPHAIVVIADDLSGAAELAGIANLRGLSSEVQRAFDPSSDADVIAVDTDSRSLAPANAAARVEHIATTVISARPAWIYKKVDSVLRGNARDEVEAILRAMATSLAVLVPANPSRGRTIKAGQLLIDGLPLHESLFRHDPEHPRTTSSVAELLGPSDRIYVPDVGDMPIITQLAQRLLPTTLPAGAADFFAALLEARGAGHGRRVPSTEPVQIDRPALLVCGSSAAWAAREGQCARAGIPTLVVSSAAELSGEELRLATARVARSGVFAIAAEQADDASRSHDALFALASVAAQLVSHWAVATILAEGGKTAAAVAERLALQRFRVVQAAPAGVGVLQPVGDIAGMAFLIKPGSYPWPDEIWRQFSRA